MPIEKLWEILDKLLLPYNVVLDKTSMNYEKVLELCVELKEINELFGNLEQISILKKALNEHSD